MASYKFTPNEIKGMNTLIGLLSKIKDLTKVTEPQAKSLKLNREILIPIAMATIMDNVIFNEAFEGLHTSTQVAECLNYLKLYKPKIQTTVYSKSYFKVHVKFRQDGHRQRYKRAYNEVQFDKVYLTDWDK